MDEAVLRRLHPPPLCRPAIFIPLEMEQSMDNVPHQLALPRRAEAACLADGFVNANENFAMQ
jgi:hypothetical protein